MRGEADVSFRKHSCGEFVFWTGKEFDSHRVMRNCAGSDKPGYAVSIADQTIKCSYCSNLVPLRAELREIVRH